jgi:hypothetical protein
LQGLYDGPAEAVSLSARLLAQNPRHAECARSPSRLEDTDPEEGALSTAELDARRIRAAKNQSLFREVNERIEELDASPSMLAEVEALRTIDFICECMDDACVDRVALPLARYEEIRSDGNSFVVAVGHNVPDVEDIVAEGDGYVVVRKVGAGIPVAKQLDPRSRAGRA